MNKPIVMHIPKDKKVIIIEGIAGSGKSTFFKDYKESIKDKMVYAYTEEELLFGWRHNFIPGITDVRLRYFEKILDYIDLKLKNFIPVDVKINRAATPGGRHVELFYKERKPYLRFFLKRKL